MRKVYSENIPKFRQNLAHYGSWTSKSQGGGMKYKKEREREKSEAGLDVNALNVYVASIYFDSIWYERNRNGVLV